MLLMARVVQNYYFRRWLADYLIQTSLADDLAQLKLLSNLLRQVQTSVLSGFLYA